MIQNYSIGNVLRDYKLLPTLQTTPVMDHLAAGCTDETRAPNTAPCNQKSIKLLIVTLVFPRITDRSRLALNGLADRLLRSVKRFSAHRFFHAVHFEVSSPPVPLVFDCLAPSVGSLFPRSGIYSLLVSRLQVLNTGFLKIRMYYWY